MAKSLRMVGVQEKDIPGIVKDLKSKEKRCHFCEKEVTAENFAGIIPQKDEYLVYCDETNCLSKAIQKIREMNGNGVI